jgi:hypothetical protein
MSEEINDLLAELLMECIQDTNGFVESFPTRLQATIRTQLMLPYTVTLGAPLRDFVRGHMMHGYKMRGEWFESLDGMHKINLPEVGRDYAKHLEFVGF